MTAIGAEAFVNTDAERQALTALRSAAGEANGPMERHCLRVFLLAEMLAAQSDDKADREVMMVASLLHDAGLYPEISRGGVYVKDGAAYASDLLSRLGWDPKRIQLCADAIERHHELRGQWDMGAEVELIRRADAIDISAGLRRFGLERDAIKEVFATVPRDGAYGEIGRLIGRALIQRPLTLPRIFLRR